RRFAQNKNQLLLGQVTVNALRGGATLEIIRRLLARGACRICTTEPRVVVMLDASRVQLVDEEELRLGSHGLCHVDVRMPVQQLVQPCGSRSRRPRDDERRSLPHSGAFRTTDRIDAANDMKALRLTNTTSRNLIGKLIPHSTR